MVSDLQSYREALEDFRRARSKAAMQRFWAGLQGKSLDLLPYDEISSKLKAVSRADRGLQVIPLDHVIGSVGRTDDFDRNFLPLRDSDIHRWARVKAAMTSPLSTGLPPISVYKLGDAYFVLDGNHRVSIAKEMGMKEIEAYVTEVHTRVPVTSTSTTEELIKKAAYANFLQETQLDLILPGIDFTLALIENYPLLREHIEVHRYYMGLERQAEVPYAEAAKHWYETVYSPVAAEIRKSGLDVEFRPMTVTDLYLWVLDQQSTLQEEMGIPISTSNTMEFLALQEGKLHKLPATQAQQEIDAALEGSLEAREVDTPSPKVDCLFKDILVAISEHDPDWLALQQAILMNTCEQGNIRGVHITQPEEKQPTEDLDQMTTRFNAMLAAGGMAGKLLVVQGSVTKVLQDHSLLSDLLVLKLTFSPTQGLFDRFSSGLISILDASRRPVMIVKNLVNPPGPLLLIYDASPKSKEALYLSAYLSLLAASKLTVQVDTTTLDMAGEEVKVMTAYLHKLGVAFEVLPPVEGNLVRLIKDLQTELAINWVVIGGYSGISMLERLFGSTVNSLLDVVDVPLLIC